MFQNSEIAGIIGTLVTSAFAAILSILGFYAKQLITRYINDGTKRKVAKTVVSAVEQLYNDLDGPEKYSKAVRRVKELLDERGITIGELEIKMLIESAVNELHSALIYDTVIEGQTDKPSVE